MADAQHRPWPVITVDIDEDGRAEIDRLGTTHTLETGNPDAARDAVRSWVAKHVATPAGRPVAVTIEDPDGHWHVAIAPDGEAVSSDHGKDKPRRRTTEAKRRGDDAPPPTLVDQDQDQDQTAAAPPNDAQDVAPTPAEPLPLPSDHAPASPLPAFRTDLPRERAGDTAPAETDRAVPPVLQSRREARDQTSFLTVNEARDPAEHGWRGFLTRLGIRMDPSPAERVERDDRRAIGQHWPGPRTIAVVNGKGGAGKTPTTVLLSALFARAGGAGVLAWDNNETRGTLGWRTEQDTHEAHVLDLLPHTTRLMEPAARQADVSAFIHHQTEDRYDVLRSNPAMLASQQRLSAEDFDATYAVATKYFRLVIVDSGNDESAPNWLRMIDRADQLVVPTTTRPEHAEAARLLLDALRQRDKRSEHLADQAVVIVSQADREEAQAGRIAEGFVGLARSVVTIPYDPAIRRTWLRLRNLSPAAHRAWLRATAEVARGL